MKSLILLSLSVSLLPLTLSPAFSMDRDDDYVESQSAGTKKSRKRKNADKLFMPTTTTSSTAASSTTTSSTKEKDISVNNNAALPPKKQKIEEDGKEEKDQQKTQQINKDQADEQLRNLISVHAPQIEFKTIGMNTPLPRSKQMSIEIMTNIENDNSSSAIKFNDLLAANKSVHLLKHFEDLFTYIYEIGPNLVWAKDIKALLAEGAGLLREGKPVWPGISLYDYLIFKDYAEEDSQIIENAFTKCKSHLENLHNERIIDGTQNRKLLPPNTIKFMYDTLCEAFSHTGTLKPIIGKEKGWKSIKKMQQRHRQLQPDFFAQIKLVEGVARFAPQPQPQPQPRTQPL